MRVTVLQEYIEGLKTSDATVSIAPAVGVTAPPVKHAAPVHVDSAPTAAAPVPSAASMLSKLSGGLMAIPGFKQHLRVLLDNNKRRADAVAAIPGSASTAAAGGVATPLQPLTSDSARTALASLAQQRSVGVAPKRTPLQKPQVPAQRFDFVSPGRWDKENARGPTLGHQAPA